MKVFAGVILLLWGDAGFAQNISVIPDTESMKHVGQSVTVEGTVAKVFTSIREAQNPGLSTRSGGHSMISGL
jgi:hypothetical protein